MKTRFGTYSPEADRFSRLWWLGLTRNFLWVGAITLLIWIFADMRFTDKRELRLTIVLTTGERDDLKILSGSSVEVTFTARGNRNGLDRFDRRLASMNLRAECDVSDYGPGEHAIPTADILDRAMGTSKEGLSIFSSAPSTIVVRLDSLILIPNVPVKPQSVGAILEKAAKVEPATVDIRVTQENWDSITKALPKAESRVVKTEPIDLKEQPTGQEVTIKAVLVREIANFLIEPQTSSVSVTFEISQRTDTKTVPVSVHVLSPLNWSTDGTWNEYILVPKDPLEWTPNIQITGAQEDLERLNAQDVQAYIVLTEDDKKPVESYLSGRVIVNLPEGLNLKLTGKVPSVLFRLDKRSKLVDTQ